MRSIGSNAVLSNLLVNRKSKMNVKEEITVQPKTADVNGLMELAQNTPRRSDGKLYEERFNAYEQRLLKLLTEAFDLGRNYEAMRNKIST